MPLRQSIFLNTKHKQFWSKDEIDPEKIIRVDWWHQVRVSLSLSLSHGCVPSHEEALTKKNPPHRFLFFQLCHGWTHYLKVVPLIQFIQSKRRHTHYAGSWTLVNAHEVGIISGLAAAYAIGGGYPDELKDDEFATLCFRSYLGLIHRKWFKKSEAVKSR